MNRYEYLEILRDKHGNRYYETFPPLEITEADIGDSPYITEWKSGNRLDIFADQFYGDGGLWWIIALASGIKDPLNIQVGDQITIPTNISNILLKIREATR